MSTCGNYSCASGGDGGCASNGGFLNGRARRLGPFSTAGARRLVHYRSSHNRARLWLVCIHSTSSPPWRTKCSSPLINGQCTSFIISAVARCLCLIYQAGVWLVSVVGRVCVDAVSCGRVPASQVQSPREQGKQRSQFTLKFCFILAQMRLPQQPSYQYNSGL